MRDPFQTDRKGSRRIKAILLDARIDSGLYKAGQWINHFFSGFYTLMSKFRTRGVARFLVEVTDEAATLGAGGLVIALALALPAFEEVKQDWRAKSDFSVTILDRYGNEIGQRGIFLNDSVPLEDIPDHLIKAALATEDRRFYTHFGIDFMGTLRALIANARAEGVVQGGSSITQQLAKNLFLTNERTLARKIKEAYLALWLEFNLSKAEILKLYLDRAYMGGGAFGVVAASEFYFGKDVRDLSLSEAAMLAGLFKAPTQYAPHVDLAAARARANEVLVNMVQAGFLTDGQILAARRNPATPVERSTETAPDFFMDWVFDEAKRLIPNGPRVLTVRSTLDPRLQQTAENAVEANLRQSGPQYNVRQAAVVLLENDGAVRTMVGGRDYGASQFNRATSALRQPGSSFKVFVYATAMLNGYSSSSIVPDAPISIGNWSPRNYTRSYAGNVSLKYALTKSINTIPVRLAQRLGRDKIVDTAYKMGVKSELLITRALPLGVAEITVIDMASAYAVFASGGYRTDPYGVLDIRDSQGNLLYSKQTLNNRKERILPVDAVTSMNDMLSNVVIAGTGRRAHIEGVTAAGKTGTTQSYRDAWFIGYTGNFTAAVWYGNDDFTATNRLTGGNLPAMTWQQIVSTAHEGIVPRPMPGVDAPIETGPSSNEDSASDAPVASVSDTGMPDKTRQLLERIAARYSYLVTQNLNRQSVDDKAAQIQ